MQGCKFIVMVAFFGSSLLSYSHNGELLDSIIQKKAKEHGIVELVVMYRTSDTSYVHEINRFNENGQVIEQLVPNHNNGYRRYRTWYDSLGRRIHFIRYDESDTTIIQSQTKWVYPDSTHYSALQYESDGKLYETIHYELRSNDTTFWVYKTEISHEYDRTTKHLSKYTHYGDTLQITEFVTYDKDGEMDDITTYYHHVATDSIKQEYLETSGSCSIESKELDDLEKNPDGLRIFYQNKQKHIQNQLDGKYTYVRGYDPHTYKIYNFKNQLIQDSYGILGMKTFEYNDQNQFTKIIGWGAPIDDHGIVETSETIIKYNELGFPISMTTRSLINEHKEVVSYTFEYR